MFLAFFNLDEPGLWAVWAEQYALGTGKSLSEALLFGEHGENMLCTEQAFCSSLYSSQTCNLQAELVCLDWADKM